MAAVSQGEPLCCVVAPPTVQSHAIRAYVCVRVYMSALCTRVHVHSSQYSRNKHPGNSFSFGIQEVIPCCYREAGPSIDAPTVLFSQKFQQKTNKE